MYIALNSVCSSLPVPEVLAAICSWNPKTVYAFRAIDEVHFMSLKLTFSSWD